MARDLQGTRLLLLFLLLYLLMLLLLGLALPVACFLPLSLPSGPALIFLSSCRLLPFSMPPTVPLFFLFLLLLLLLLLR